MLQAIRVLIIFNSIEVIPMISFLVIYLQTLHRHTAGSACEARNHLKYVPIYCKITLLVLYI